MAISPVVVILSVNIFTHLIVLVGGSKLLLPHSSLRLLTCIWLMCIIAFCKAISGERPFRVFSLSNRTGGLNAIHFTLILYLLIHLTKVNFPFYLINCGVNYYSKYSNSIFYLIFNSCRHKNGDLFNSPTSPGQSTLLFEENIRITSCGCE